MEENRHYMRPKGKGIKLHLGCGDYWFEGFLNIDIGVYGGTDMIWDITKGLPFQSEVVERIEMYEVLEHLNQQEVDSLLEEFKRLLIDGGTVRLSVPDLEKLFDEYKETDNKEKIVTYIYGFGGHQHHQWGYNKEMLTKLFEKHGFKEIKVEQGFLEERPGEHKLILEAVK